MDNTATLVLSDWLESLDQSGNISATVSRLVPGDRDTSAVAEDGQIVITVPPGLVGESTKVEIFLRFPTMVIEGLRATDAQFMIDRVSFPDSFDVAVLTASAEAVSADVEFEGSYDDLLLEGLVLPKSLPSSGAGALPSVTLLSYLDAFRQIAIARGFAAKATTSSTSDSGLTSSFVYEDMALVGLSDGRISEQSVGHVRLVEDVASAAGAPSQMEITANGVILRGFDIVPLMALLGGPVEDGRTVLLDREEFNDIAFSQDGVSGRIRNILLEDISVADLSPVRFAALLDRDASGEQVNDEELGLAALEAVGRLRLGRFELGDLDVTSTDTAASLRRFLIRDLTGGGLREVSLDGLSVAATDIGQTDINHAGIGHVGLPSLEALIALDSPADPTTDQLLAAMPTIGKIIASGINIVAPSDMVPGSAAGEQQLQAGVSLIEIVQGGFLDTIPTRTSVIIDGATLPAAYLDDPSLRSVLEALDLQEIEINQALSVKWHPDTLDLTLSNASISVLDGGTASLSLTLGNVPSSLFTTPRLAEIALAGATVKSGTLRLQGGDLLDALLDEQARSAGVSRELFAEGLAEAVRAELTLLAGSPFEAKLITALRGFFNNPEEIEVELAPQTPVPVTELLGLAISTPKAIPERLGARIHSAQ